MTVPVGISELRDLARPHEAAGAPLPDAIRYGVFHCRRGEWHSGLHYLLQARRSTREEELPAAFFSFFGLALARCGQANSDSIALCERGAAMAFYDPEVFLNLAWACLLGRQRSRAMSALRRGLTLEPNHEGLRSLHARLGVRRSPPLPFLPRDHAFNRAIGRWLHSRRSRLAPA